MNGVQIIDVRAVGADSELISLILSDGSEVLCSYAEYVSLNLPVDGELTEADSLLLQRSARVIALKRLALRKLAARPMSRKELKSLLLRSHKNKPAPAVDEVETALSQLDTGGYVNDEAFAAFWVDQRDRFRPRSARMLRAELANKGVSREIIDDMATQGSEIDRAVKAGSSAARTAKRRFGDDRKAFNVLAGAALQRRGFTFAIIRQALDILWDEHSSE